MSLETLSTIDRIEFNGDGSIYVRRKDYHMIGSTEIFIGHHFHHLTPGMDLSGEPTQEKWYLTPEVKQAAMQYWTAEVVEKWNNANQQGL